MLRTERERLPALPLGDFFEGISRSCKLGVRPACGFEARG